MPVIFLVSCIAALISESLSANGITVNAEVSPTTTEAIHAWETAGHQSPSHVETRDPDVFGLIGLRLKMADDYIRKARTSSVPKTSQTLWYSRMAMLIYYLTTADTLFARYYFDVLNELDDKNHGISMDTFNEMYTFPQEDIWTMFKFIISNKDSLHMPKNIERHILGLTEKYQVSKYATSRNNTEVFNWFYERGIINIDTLRTMDLDQAIKAGFVDLLRRSDIEKLLSEGESLLHVASRNGKISLLKKFIDDGSNISAVDSNNKTPLEYAVEGGHEDIVEYLLSKGADINISLGPQGTLLHIAVINKNKSMVEFLLKAGISVDSIDSEGQTPLYLAAKAQDYEIARSLWRRGAEVNFENEDGDSLLHIAAKHGDVKAIEGLIEMGACVDSSNDGMTPLYRAAQYGNLDSMKTLLENSADINYGPFEGNKLIHVAARNNHSLAVESLLDMGVDVDLRGKYEFTALHWASRVGFYNIIEVLLKRNANIEARIDIGRTPLHEGAFWGQIKSCYTLVANGANTKALDNSKRRPSELARDSGHLALYRILRDFENKV